MSQPQPKQENSMSTPVKYRTCHHSQWIKTTVEGKLDLEQSLQIIRTLDDDPALPSPYDVLIDLRDAPCELTIADVTEVVACMQRRWEAFGMGRKLAVVVDGKAALDKAKFMELYAHNRGFRVEAFDDLEAAKSWLEVDAAASNAPNAGGSEATGAAQAAAAQSSGEINPVRMA